MEYQIVLNKQDFDVIQYVLWMFSDTHILDYHVNSYIKTKEFVVGDNILLPVDFYSLWHRLMKNTGTLSKEVKTDE